MRKKVDYFKRCEICGCKIPEGERYYDFDGDAVCEEYECFTSYIDDHYRRTCVDENYEAYLSEQEGMNR